tara:strand:+ start:900 stop:1310 length:411 start_codon:yes stop_codon:yes gene_type:complete
MKYCSFSSDGFQCDLLAYTVTGGYAIQVAERRYNNPSPLPQDYLRLKKSGKDWDKRTLKAFNSATKKWQKEQSKLSDDECYTKITLDQAGESFWFDDIEQFRDKMYELMELGFWVDWGVIALINEDIKNVHKGVVH